jgi:hypothetical protein
MSNYSSYQQPYPPPETSAWAIVSLISGILGWLGLFGFGGLVAVISGHMAKGQIRRGMGRVTGDGIASIGLVLGYANLALSLAGCCLVVLIMTGAIAVPFFLIPLESMLQGM